MNRRSLLRASALGLPVAVLLAACGSTAPTVSSVETYAQNVLNGLSAVLALPTIQADLGANLAKAQAALDDAQAAYAALTGGVGSLINTASQTTTQQISSDATTILGLVQMVPGIPSAVATILTAIQVVLPVMLASVGVTSTKAAPSSMSLHDAMAVLSSRKV